MEDHIKQFKLSRTTAENTVKDIELPDRQMEILVKILFLQI